MMNAGIGSVINRTPLNMEAVGANAVGSLAVQEVSDRLSNNQQLEAEIAAAEMVAGIVLPEPVLDLSHEAIGKQQADYNSRVGFFQSRPNAGQKAARGPKTSAVQKAPIGQQQTNYNSPVGRTQNRPNVAQNTPMGFYTESGYAMGEGAYAAGRMGSTIGKGMTPTQQAQYAEGAGMRSGEELGMLVTGGAGIISTPALSLAAGYIGNALMLGPIAEASILSAPLVGEGMVLGMAIQKGLGIVKSRLGFFERGGAGAESFGSKITFELAPRVEQQLADSRMGSLAGKLDAASLNELTGNPKAQLLYDAGTGNINVINNVDGKLLRITTPRDSFKIISVGPIQERNIINSINSGRFIPIGNQLEESTDVVSYMNRIRR